ncbi:MAG TPA: Rieske 2Fe-2S domain-containing protein [Acidimicrobiales bacterium]|nr:Rieske 2Fe-2S domain-containing protein [Acidimicrobiales bacterium]
MTRASARERRLPFRAPVRAWAQAEWVLLPLRAFLGVTFLYAGLQKLANPNFFNAQSPSSIQAQLIAAVRVTPIKFLLTHLVQFAKPIGLVISLAEVAVGVGALLGLWTRVAAIGGALLSFSLFLTVSFHASPYFTGADIVFFFAWLPLIVAGGGSRTTVDAWIARRAAKMERAPSPTLVAIPFVEVQRLCGHFKSGRCSAREGRPCDAAACPVLLGPREPLGVRGTDAVDRRSLVLGGAAAATTAGAAALLAAATAGIGRALGRAKAPVAPTQLGSPTTTTPGGSTPTTVASGASGTLLGPAKDVPVGNAASFTVPATGDPGLVVQPSSGQFYAYDAVCPHAGCTVGYYSANHVIACPCHGSTFAVTTGDVLSGPSPRGLYKLNVVEESDGNLYLK